MKRKLIIYLAGIDGSGKSTLAESLCDELQRNGLSCKYLWGGWRSFESPLFKRVVSRTKKTLVEKGEEEKVQEAHNSMPLFGYLMWLDYFVRVYPSLLASLLTHDIVVLDRYIYDVIAGLTRDKRVSRVILSLFKVFPPPSIVFFIRVPLEVAFRRKDDIPSIEFLRNIEETQLSILAQCSVKVVTLDGTLSKNELRDSALTVTQTLLT
jgi:thymidylate kinase